MKVSERRNKIYALLKSNREISVSALAEQFCVSTMTIRRDLIWLENSQLINRAYGKAQLAEDHSRESAFRQRSQINLPLKQRIARTALPYLNDLSTFYVDSSTTACELLKLLPEEQPYTVFTNSFEALKLLSDRPMVRAYVIGGFLQQDGNTLLDETSLSVLRQIYPDAAFLSCDGFSREGVFIRNSAELPFKKMLLENSARTFILADHTKAYSKGLFLLDTWESVHHLITDRPINARYLDTLRTCGVQVEW